MVEELGSPPMVEELGLLFLLLPPPRNFHTSFPKKTKIDVLIKGHSVRRWQASRQKSAPRPPFLDLFDNHQNSKIIRITKHDAFDNEQYSKIVNFFLSNAFGR
jgi:hypothetical protein